MGASPIPPRPLPPCFWQAQWCEGNESPARSVCLSHSWRLPTGPCPEASPDGAERRRWQQGGQRGLQEREHWESQISTLCTPTPICAHTHTHACTRTHAKLQALRLTAETQPGQRPAYNSWLRALPSPRGPSRRPQLSCPIAGWRAGAWPGHKLQN